MFQTTNQINFINQPFGPFGNAEKNQLSMVMTGKWFVIVLHDPEPFLWCWKQVRVEKKREVCRAFCGEVDSELKKTLWAQDQTIKHAICA